MTGNASPMPAAEKTSRRVAVTKAFECRRVASDTCAAPAQIIVYPAGWEGRMPGHHIASGEALGCIERLA